MPWTYSDQSLDNVDHTKMKQICVLTCSLIYHYFEHTKDKYVYIFYNYSMQKRKLPQMLESEWIE